MSKGSNQNHANNETTSNKIMGVLLTAGISIAVMFSGFTFSQGQDNTKGLADYKVKVAESYASHKQVTEGFKRIERQLEIIQQDLKNK